MPSDPWAQYLTPPSGATSAPATGDDPYAKYLPGAATTTAAQPAASSSNPLSDAALAFADEYTLGLGRKNPFMAMPQSLGEDIKKAHQNLGWADYPLSIAAYTLGPGKFLGPVGATASLAGRPIAQAAAEGALAGGISGFDPSNPVSSTAEGALGGAVVGGAAGGAGKLISKLTTKTPQVDPAAAVAANKSIRANAYDQLHAVPTSPDGVDSVIGGVMDNLDPSVKDGMSPGLESTINKIRNTVQGLSDANMGQVNSWQRTINAAAQREAHPSDSFVAGKIDSGLNDLIQQGGAGDLNNAANKAHAQYMDSLALQKLQQNATEFGQGPGNIPQQQIAAGGYQPGDPRFQAWANISRAGQRAAVDPSYAAAHLGADLGETVGLAALGPVGMLGGKVLGYLGGKFTGKKAMGNLQNRALLRAIQGQYPTLTGQGPPTALPNPAIGDLIKNLAIGGAY